MAARAAAQAAVTADSEAASVAEGSGEGGAVMAVVEWEVASSVDVEAMAASAVGPDSSARSSRHNRYLGHTTPGTGLW